MDQFVSLGEQVVAGSASILDRDARVGVESLYLGVAGVFWGSNGRI
jgi:hypothetical protein